MSITPSSPHGSQRTSPPQKLARPDFPQPRRSSPLEKEQATQRYSMTDPKTVSLSTPYPLYRRSFDVRSRDVRRGVFLRDAAPGCGGIQTAATADFITASADWGTRV